MSTFFYPWHPYPTNNESGVTLGSVTKQPNDGSDILAYIIAAPKTGNLKRVGFGMHGGTTQSNGSTIRVAFRALTGGATSAYLEPTGTEDEFRDVILGVNGEQFFTSGIISDDGTDTGVLRAVTGGDLLAITVRMSTFFAGDDIVVYKLDGLDSEVFYMEWFTAPRIMFFDGAVWSTESVPNAYSLAVQYDDDLWTSVHPYLIPAKKVSNFDIPAGEEAGLRLRSTSKFSIAGASCATGNVASGEFLTTLALYDNALTKVRESAGTKQGGTAADRTTWMFEPFVCDANANYFLVVHNPASAGTVRLYGFEFSAVELMDALPGKQDWYRVDRGDFVSAFNTSTLVRPQMYPILNDGAINSSLGGGGIISTTGLNRGLN